jgi:hypothetical protein
MNTFIRIIARNVLSKRRRSIQPVHLIFGLVATGQLDKAKALEHLTGIVYKEPYWVSTYTQYSPILTGELPPANKRQGDYNFSSREEFILRFETTEEQHALLTDGPLTVNRIGTARDVVIKVINDPGCEFMELSDKGNIAFEIPYSGITNDCIEFHENILPIRLLTRSPWQLDRKIATFAYIKAATVYNMSYTYRHIMTARPIGFFEAKGLVKKIRTIFGLKYNAMPAITGHNLDGSIYKGDHLVIVPLPENPYVPYREINVTTRKYNGFIICIPKEVNVNINTLDMLLLDHIDFQKETVSNWSNSSYKWISSGNILTEAVNNRNRARDRIIEELERVGVDRKDIKQISGIERADYYTKTDKEKYLHRGHKFCWNVKAIEFRRPINGPLLVGPGSCDGYGVFYPVNCEQ